MDVPGERPWVGMCYKAALTVWKRFFRLVQNKVMKSFPLLSEALTYFAEGIIHAGGCWPHIGMADEAAWLLSR